MVLGQSPVSAQNPNSIMLILGLGTVLFAHFHNSLWTSAYTPPTSLGSFCHLIVLSDMEGFSLRPQVILGPCGWDSWLSPS